jgi:hypothetical protein
LSSIIRLAIGIPLGQTIFGWITFLLSTRSPFQPYHGLFSLLLQTLSAYFLNRRNSQPRKQNRHTFNSVAFLSFLSFSTLLTWIFYNGMLYESIRTLSSGHADFPIHMGLIASFTHGCNTHRKHLFDIVTPFYSGEPLAYSFMPDFYTATLMLSGCATLRCAVFVPSLLMVYSLVYAIYSLAVLFCDNPWVGFISLFLFFNLGGLGFIRWSDPSRKWLGDSVFRWGNQEHGYWFHSILQVLIPQRGVLFALPICYWTLFLLIQGVIRDDSKLMSLAGILTAATPQLMVHGYVALAQWSIAFCLIKFPWKNRSKWFGYVRLWLWFGMIAVAFGLPQFYPFLGRLANQHSSDQFLRIIPIYKKFLSNLIGASDSWTAIFKLWWRGLGVFAAIALCFGFVLLDRLQLSIYFPSLIVFAFANFVLYQPWECDNLKIHYSAWIPIALPVVGQYIFRLLRLKKTWAIGIVLLIACSLSAAWQTLTQSQNRIELMEADAVQVGLWVSENVPRTAVFVAQSWHAIPTASIAGRQSFMGSSGLLAGHGLERSARLEKLRAMQTSPNNTALFESNGVEYVYTRADSDTASFEQFVNNTAWIKVWEMNRQRIWRRFTGV